ncbi:E4 SUMO-protein ligase PIAL2-like isoform X2 [Durio zibethinus]|uniref:E4 SUMO-protein ligase PIAL2-like isoform X2 n=1 Tax=Durio zibethinus TaxID=66656 RepID=A0A6P5YAU7_DURZI|nr:E4 SUMO-protein ligase PIAL2-like isoform X2 [Durio zibethinus]
MTAIPPVAATASGLGVGQQISASMVNSFRVAAVAERLATHTQPGRQPQNSEFFSLCLSLARGIDYAIANNEVPAKAKELPLLLKQICQRRNDLFLQAAIMVLMISVKNACKMSWFSDKESQELFALANEVGSCFCSPGDINNGLDGSLSTILAVMSRFYPLMKMGQILASLEAKPGYGALVIDFHISKNATHSPLEKIRLFVAQIDNIETSACIISPQQVNFLLNGKGVERRTNVLMDMGPQMPTNVTAMLKYGTNLLQAVGRFCGHYIIVIAFMSMESSPDPSMLPDYVQSGDVALDSDSDIIEGPSRISLKCPISRTRIKTPVKGHACKHLQCFDFNNYVDINSRRPSWRCPHCNQHVCYTDIRVDQNMFKVLKDVSEDVSDVIISADGSWKAVLDNDDNVDELHDKILNYQKDGSEQPESAKAVPIVLDLTQDDDEVDAMDTIEIEDRKPVVANLQSQSAAPKLTITPELTNTVGVNQNVASHMDEDFWSGLYSSHGSGISTARTDAQVGGISESTPSNFTVSPVFSDAISPAPNRTEARGNANLTALGIQNQVSAASNLQLQQSQLINSMPTHEYGTLQHIPRHLNRTPIAVQALPALSQTPTLQQRSRNSLNTLSTNGSPLPPQANMSMAPSVSSDMERQPQFSRSPANPHQSWNQQERLFAPGQSVQQVGVAASSQLPGSYRASSGLLGEYQNPHLQQALNPRVSQPRSPSPGLIRSPSPLLRTQTQQGAAQVGLGYTAGNVNSNPTRFMAAAQRATQMARQPPMVAVQTQSSRAASYSGNVDGSRASAVEQRLNMGGLTPAASRADTSADLVSEQNWRPTGRMRGSLTGRAYSEALSQLMIQPTQSAQAARPQANLTSSPSVPPHLQALLANSRNPAVPQMQNNAITETAGMNGSSVVLPDRSGGMR